MKLRITATVFAVATGIAWSIYLTFTVIVGESEPSRLEQAIRALLAVAGVVSPNLLFGAWLIRWLDQQSRSASVPVRVIQEDTVQMPVIRAVVPAPNGIDASVIEASKRLRQRLSND